MGFKRKLNTFLTGLAIGTSLIISSAKAQPLSLPLVDSITTQNIQKTNVLNTNVPLLPEICSPPGRPEGQKTWLQGLDAALYKCWLEDGKIVVGCFDLPTLDNLNILTEEREKFSFEYNLSAIGIKPSKDAKLTSIKALSTEKDWEMGFAILDKGGWFYWVYYYLVNETGKLDVNSGAIRTNVNLKNGVMVSGEDIVILIDKEKGLGEIILFEDRKPVKHINFENEFLKLINMQHPNIFNGGKEAWVFNGDGETVILLAIDVNTREVRLCAYNYNKFLDTVAKRYNLDPNRNHDNWSAVGTLSKGTDGVWYDKTVLFIKDGEKLFSIGGVAIPVTIKGLEEFANDGKFYYFEKESK